MGAPMPAAANAVPPMAPVAPQLPQPTAPTTPDIASTLPASAQTPVFDTAHAPVADVAPAPPPTHTPTSDVGTTYVAGPAGTAVPPFAAAPAGPLPAYGADIRPPAPIAAAHSTAPAGPPPGTAPAAPAAPSSGAGGIGQPAVVRRPETLPTPSPTPAGVGEQAVVATAGGAAAGAASAAATARARLQRLVDAVARQEPRLSWAAGDRPDGTTVLVTDLVSGWIPPDIDIPVGMQLREPARRRGDLEALLGEVTVAASYTRMHYLPPAEDAEPVPTSPRARQGPVVEELGWELCQATKWRDGLPQLAHTLARAASRGTGVLDLEIEMLRDLLEEVRDRVLNSYPDSVDAAAVGNWQLLAAIDALVEGDKTGANYHFAWFQALSQATTGGAM
ncbi:MAG TPA: DUF5631 domain-containing protein [Mycobacterium sp.]|nr:DUF5631 domain-containing protein [Mycobacterium sp.]